MSGLTAIQEALSQAQASAVIEKDLVTAARKTSDDKLTALHLQVASLESQIGGLQIQLSNGTALSNADITAIISQITDVKTAISDILPAPVAPTVPVDPAMPAPTV